MDEELRREGDDVAPGDQPDGEPEPDAPDHLPDDHRDDEGVVDQGDASKPESEPEAVREAGPDPSLASHPMMEDEAGRRLSALQPPVSGPAAELYETLLKHLATHDKALFVRTAVESVTHHSMDIPSLYRDVLTPLLRQMGGGWQRGEVAVWEEHLATAMVRTVVEILYPGVLKAKSSRPPDGRVVLLANPPEENHELGLRMVADRFDIAGWTTHFLGADTPVEEVLAAARKLRVDAVVVSSATHFHRLALRAFVDRLKSELPDVAVWVGGSAFLFDREGWSEEDLLDIDAFLAGPPRPEPDWEWEDKE